MSLAGKVVLITGGRRVGGDLALLLAEQGAAVAMTYRTSRDAIEATVAEVEARGARGLAIEADLARAGLAERAVQRTVDAFGRLDALVNMVSTFRRTPFDDLTPADFDDMVAANLAAPYFTAVAAGKTMRSQPGGDDGLKGRIVFIGDTSTERSTADYLPYIVAKGALTTLTLALARELAPDVAVNLVQPGTIEPPPDATEAQLDRIRQDTPLGRIGTPGDVNRLILYLLDGTNFANAATFRVDGGRFLGPG